MSLSNSGVLTPTSDLSMGTNSISGSIYTRTANNILSCLTTPTYGNIPMFSTVGKQLEDSSISSFNVITGPVNNIAVYSSTSGKAITTATSGIGTIGALTVGPTSVSPIIQTALTLRGPASSGSAGPHIIACVDQYPVYEMFALITILKYNLTVIAIRLRL